MGLVTEVKKEDIFKRKTNVSNPWLDPAFNKVESLGGEPGFKVDDIPERLGLVQQGFDSASPTYYFTDLEDAPSGYGTKGQFLQTDGESKLSWAWPYWIKAGSNIYYKKGKVAIGVSSPRTDLDVAGSIASRDLTLGSIPFIVADSIFGQDNANLFWDAAQDFLGVGVGGPLCRAHIRGAVCADYAGLHPDTVLLLENDDDVSLQLQCATDGEAWINFADDAWNPPAGQIEYQFTDDYMIFAVATAISMYLTSIGLGAGNIIPTNPFHVLGPGTDVGGLAGGSDVAARFQQTNVGHTGISIDSQANYDPVLYLAENGEAQWDIRSDASESDEFQIRYQGRAVVNRTDFKIDTTGNVSILTGYLALMGNNEIRFYDNGNYVGFEAPALGADQIWILPDADASQAGSPLVSDASGTLSWAGAVDLGAGNFVTTGTLGSGKLTVDSGEGQAIIIKGTSTGNANLGWIGFYDSDGTTRRGHIGDGSVGNDDIYIGADTGYLRLLAAGYISLGTHTYFPDDVVMSFGASLDYSIGYYSTDDEFQIVDGSTLDSNVRLKLDSSGHFDFGAGNLTTTGRLGVGTTAHATAKLYLYGGVGGGSIPTGDDVAVFEDDDSVYFNFITPTNAWGGILISDDVRARGGFLYTHGAGASERIKIYSGGAEQLSIDTSGNVGLDVTAFGTNAVTVFAQKTGTAPTTSPADCFQMYSADQVGGNACLHTRTENGAVVKLYQQAHIIDADGQLADITTKFNTLLSYFENNGLLASA